MAKKKSEPWPAQAVPSFKSFGSKLAVIASPRPLPPDFAKFPLLKLAYECLYAGGSATCTLNAADEIAVEAFLEGRIPFTAIWEVVQETLCKMPVRQPATVGEILEIDRESRALAREVVVARTAAVVTA